MLCIYLCICIYENPNNFTKNWSRAATYGRGALCKLAETFPRTMSWNLLVMAALGLGHLLQFLVAFFFTNHFTIVANGGGGGGSCLDLTCIKIIDDDFNLSTKLSDHRNNDDGNDGDEA